MPTSAKATKNRTKSQGANDGADSQGVEPEGSVGLGSTGHKGEAAVAQWAAAQGPTGAFEPVHTRASGPTGHCRVQGTNRPWGGQIGG